MYRLLGVSAALCLSILALSLSTASAQEAAAGAKATLTFQETLEGENVLLAGSCSIDCGDGRTYETDAGTVIGCACDCADVCGGTCEATDGSQTRTCSSD
jgi:hypothetical protein